MPHAEDTSRPSSHSNGKANASSSSGLGIRSRFRELGITSGGITRSKSHSRNHSDVSDKEKTSTATSSKQYHQIKPLLPLINVDEFMPTDLLREKAEQLRKELEALRISIEALEKQKAEIGERRQEIKRMTTRIRELAEEHHMQDRAAKVDFWALRLNRRRAGDAQMFQTRVARRALSTKSQASGASASSAGSVYTTDSFNEGETAP